MIRTSATILSQLPSGSLSKMRLQSFESWTRPPLHPEELFLTKCSVEIEGICFIARGIVDGNAEQCPFAMGRWELAEVLKAVSQAGSAGGWTGELRWVQLFDFPSCSFEASILNRKKKNNPLCQPFVAPSSLFPPKSKENGQDSFCPKSICVFYIGLGFEASIVKWEKRQRFFSNLSKSKEGFLKPCHLIQNSPGWPLPIYTVFAGKLGMEISTARKRWKLDPTVKKQACRPTTLFSQNQRARPARGVGQGLDFGFSSLQEAALVYRLVRRP